MVSASGRSLPALFVGLLAVGCGGRTIPITIQLLTQSCPGSDGQQVNALDAVTHLEFIVTGDGIDEPLTTNALVEDGTAMLAEIPLGAPGQIARRTIEVRGHFNAADGPILSRGFTVVELSTDSAAPITVPIFLRPLNKYVFTNDSTEEETCTVMNRARAGHTATALPDGRAVIVGGADIDALGGRTVHDSAEIYDPNTGLFELKPREPDGPNQPRVFHTATALSDGRVLIVGGEFDLSPTNRDVLRPAEIFDPITNVFSDPIVANQGRTRHTATRVDGDYVLVAGGYADPDPPPGQPHPTPIASAEIFDIENNRFTVAVALPEEKAEHCAVGIGNGVVALIGGKHLDVNGTDVVASANIHFMQCSGGACVPVAPGGVALVHLLSTARFGMGCFALDTGPTTVKVIIAGGYTTVDNFTAASAHAGIEIFDPGGAPAVQSLTSALSAARGNICTVPLVGSNGLVTAALFIGGLNRDDVPAGIATERLSLEQDVIGLTSVTPGMQEARSLHQCTLLADGSVLITGGLAFDGAGNSRSLRSAEIFTPIVRE